MPWTMLSAGSFMTLHKRLRPDTIKGGDLWNFLPALSVLAAICVSGGVGFYLNKHLNAKRIGDATELATRIVEESRKEAQAQKKEILLQGQDELFNQKRELEHEFKERERELKARDRKLQEQGERLEEKLEKATEKEHELLSVEKDLSKKERKLAELEETLNERIDEQEHRLQEVSGLTAEEARQRLLRKSSPAPATRPPR